MWRQYSGTSMGWVDQRQYRQSAAFTSSVARLPSHSMACLPVPQWPLRSPCHASCYGNAMQGLFPNADTNPQPYPGCTLLQTGESGVQAAGWLSWATPRLLAAQLGMACPPAATSACIETLKSHVFKHTPHQKRVPPPRTPHPRRAVCDLGSRLPGLQAAQLRMVRGLLAAGAAPMARDSSGLTAIHKACYYAAGPKVVRALLGAGCDPRDRARSHDKSSLDMAANQGHPRSVGLAGSQQGCAAHGWAWLGRTGQGRAGQGRGAWHSVVVQGRPAISPLV